MTRYRELKEITGIDLEEQLLGEEVKRPARYDGTKKSFGEALNLVRKYQPDGWNPEDPPIAPTSFPSDFHLKVLEALEADLKNHEGKLTFLTARKSFLDRLYGTDLIVTFEPVKGRIPEAIVTVDVTWDPDKKDKQDSKANVIVFFPAPYSELSESDREVILGNAAEEVVQFIREKLGSEYEAL